MILHNSIFFNRMASKSGCKTVFLSFQGEELLIGDRFRSDGEVQRALKFEPRSSLSLVGN